MDRIKIAGELLDIAKDLTAQFPIQAALNPSYVGKFIKKALISAKEGKYLSAANELAAVYNQLLKNREESEDYGVDKYHINLLQSLMKEYRNLDKIHSSLLAKHDELADELKPLGFTASIQAAESLSQDEAFKRYNEGERSGEVYGAFMGNRVPWFNETVKKYKIGITQSDLKKAKKELKKVTTNKPRDIANGIVYALMAKGNKSGFASRVEMMRHAEAITNKMSDAELFTIRHMMKNV